MVMQVLFMMYEAKPTLETEFDALLDEVAFSNSFLCFEVRIFSLTGNLCNEKWFCYYFDVVLSFLFIFSLIG
jgi:hypothetical protein